MKKNLSIAGFSLVAMGLFMGSCVSKRKYMEAQTSAAQRYTTDSTQWATRSATMQQNISSLEQKSTDYQKQMDSFKTSAMNYQKRWDNLNSTYTQQNTATEQLNQQIHTAIDQYVEASNVESKNGKIYVNLPEKMLFTSGSSTLSAKGKQALDKLAEVIATNQNVDVDIIASAAYYNDGTGMADNTGKDDKNVSSSTDPSTSVSRTEATGTEKNNAAKSDNNAAKSDKMDDSAANRSTASSSNANVGDSSYPGSGSVTARKTKQDPNKKSQTTTKSSTVKKSSTATATKNNQGDRSVSFKSTPKSSTKSKTTKSTAPSWNLNVARSTAIVRELTTNGLPQARIILTGQNGKGITTNEWASTNKGYQIVLSPKMDSYYQMLQEGQGSTGMK